MQISDEIQYVSEYWADFSHADPRNLMTRRPPGKVFPGARVCQDVCARRDPLCSNLDPLLKQMQMHPLRTAIERGYGTSGRVLPLFGDRIVHFDCCEFSRTTICESL